MSWPIGYALPNVDYTYALDGTILADGIRVTESHGWLDVDVPVESADGNPASTKISVQIRLESDAHGHALMSAQQLVAQEQTYRDVHALKLSGRERWAESLPTLVLEEIRRRMLGGIAARPSLSPPVSHARVSGLVRPPAVTRGEPWPLVVVPRRGERQAG